MVRTKPGIESNGEIYRKMTLKKANSIDITPAFQRGGENGVWKTEAKQKYIVSLMKGWPTGIVTLVVQDMSADEAPMQVLDGGNRLRALRKFLDNDLKIVWEDNEEYYFEELDPMVQSRFQDRLFYTQTITIEKNDPPDTISSMFCNLNTTGVKLSDGELLKAHGWMHDIWEIELAKKLIGEEKAVCHTICCDIRFNEIRKGWQQYIGELSMDNRYNILYQMVSFIISAKTEQMKDFTGKYNEIKYSLSKSNVEPKKEEVDRVHDKMKILIEVMKELKYSKSESGEINHEMLGKPMKGMPNKNKISALWSVIALDGYMKYGKICLDNMIKYYNENRNNTSSIEEYKKILQSGGDNHTTNSKLTNLIAYMFQSVNDGV